MTPVAGILRKSAAAALRGIGFALALVWVVSEDLARLAVEPLVSALARVAFWRRLEAMLAALPPWGCLLALAIPWGAIVQPAEIVGLVWMAEGSFAAGALLLAVSKILGMALLLRMHAIAYDKLMTIGWYATVFRWAMALRERIYDAVLAVPGVRDALAAVRDVVGRLRAAAAPLIDAALAALRRAFACLRARLASMGEG